MPDVVDASTWRWIAEYLADERFEHRRLCLNLDLDAIEVDVADESRNVVRHRDAPDRLAKKHPLHQAANRYAAALASVHEGAPLTSSA
jgi:hypothetical protein